MNSGLLKKKNNCKCKKSEKGNCLSISKICEAVNSIRKKYENPKIYVKYKNGKKKVILRNINEKYYADNFLRDCSPQIQQKKVDFGLTRIGKIIVL